MPYCSRCDREDISPHWEFCPRCGTGLADSAPVLKSTKVTPQTKDVKGVLVDMALDFAQGMTQKTLTATLLPGSRVPTGGNSTSVMVDSAFDLAKGLAKKQLSDRFSPTNKFMGAGSPPGGAFIDLAFDLAKGLAQKKLNEKVLPTNQGLTVNPTAISKVASGGDWPHWYREVVASGGQQRGQAMDRTELALRQAQALKNAQDREKYGQMAWTILQSIKTPGQQ